MATRAFERSLIVSAAAGLCALLLAAVLVRYGPSYAAVALAVPIGGWLIFEHPAVGLFAAIAVVLVIPHSTAHAWLVPPLAIGFAIACGAAVSRIRIVDLVVAALVVVLTLSWVTHPEGGIETKTFLQGVLPFVMYFGVRMTERRFTMRTALWVVFGAGTVATLSVLYDWATQTVHFSDPAFYQWASERDIFRAGGIFGGSPAAGVGLAMVLLLSTSLLRSRRRWLVGAWLALMGWAIVIVYARAAWIGLGMGLIVVAILLPVRLPSVRVGLVGALAVLAAFAFYLSVSGVSVSERLSGSKLYQQGVVRPYSSETRAQFLKLAFPLVADSREHFVLGRGFNAFQGKPSDPDAAAKPTLFTFGGPHNEYLRAFLEQGLIGFLLVVSWIGGSIAIGVRSVRRLPKRSDARLLVAALTGSVVVIAVANFFHDWMHSPVTVSLTALVTGLLVTAAGQAHATGESEPERLGRRAARARRAIPRGEPRRSVLA